MAWAKKWDTDPAIAQINNAYPNAAKAGALQSQGTKGESVALYCDPLVTPDLEGSGFPEGWKTHVFYATMGSIIA